MKIALASVRIVDGDINYNLSQMECYMKVAKANGASLVCFGEAFLQGFNALSWQYEKDKDIAISTSSSIFSQIKEWTKQLCIDVLFGYNELVDDSIYSSCALIANGEIVYNYRRVSKGWKEYWKTDAHYKEGNSIEVFEYKGKKCLIALCGDLWEFPDKFRLGEDVLFWPVYVSGLDWENSEKLEYAKQAKLSGGKTLYINSISNDEGFGGAAYFYEGIIKKELPISIEAVLYLEI